MSKNFKIRDNLEKFVRDVLKEDNISPYELSRRTECNETLWKNFLEGRTKMPDSGAIVRLADYKKMPLDTVVGIDISQEIKLTEAKKIIKENVNKKGIESKIPVFITELPVEARQSVIQVGEEASKFTHKPLVSNQQRKSFVERVKESNKPTGRSR